jgi:hypothetical protein
MIIITVLEMLVYGVFDTFFRAPLPVVGGLFSIDYDAKNDLYYFICDDRAVYNDARFYTAKIHLGTNKIDSVALKCGSLKKCS